MALPRTNYQEIRDSQRQNDVNFAAYKLPQLPDNREEIYERLVEADRLFSPERTLDSYDDGTARNEDELLVREGRGALFTAEHATTRWRLEKGANERRRQGADPGTGALGSVYSEDVGTAFIAPLGRQTMDANYDVEHPLKDHAHTFLKRPDIGSAVSLHRIFLGRVATPQDIRGYNLIFGVGPSPTPETVDAVDKMLDIAKTYDLRAGVNQSVLTYEKDGVTPRRNEDGEFQTLTFAATPEGTTRAFAQKAAREIGKPLVAVQIEISQANLVFPDDHKHNPGRSAQVIGSFLAYQFLRDAAPVLMGATK